MNERKKMKEIALKEIFFEKTDLEHGLTLKEIQNLLESRYEIRCERKTLYNDIEELEDFGCKVVYEKILPTDTVCKYHCVERDFELAELKMLSDAVLAARFLSAERSRSLIKKLGNLTSDYYAHNLMGASPFSLDKKPGNEDLYHTIDTIYAAFGKNKKIRFQYFKWDIHKKQVDKNPNNRYEISPWELVWDDENYYLIGYNEDKEEGDRIRTYRIDKMRNVSVINAETRAGEKEFKNYKKEHPDTGRVTMYHGDPCNITIEYPEDLVGVILDKFGMNIPIIPENAEKKLYRSPVNVTLSRHLIAWIMALGDVKIVKPKEAVTEVQKFLKEQGKIYK